MKTVGVRELKQNASQVMAQVENGESFIVTEQGRDVGRIAPAVRAIQMTTEHMMPV
jgi:prevent-host-death family protein